FRSLEPSVEVASVTLGEALRSLHVTLAGFLEPGTLYNVTVKNVRDCNHNLASEDRVSFAIPEPADSLDIVINEVLFNPKSGGVDFVEIFNRSRKFINLKGWSTADFSDGTPKDFRIVTEGDWLLPPDSYAVLTADAAVLLDYYPDAAVEALIEMRLTSLPDD